MTARSCLAPCQGVLGFLPFAVCMCPNWNCGYEMYPEWMTRILSILCLNMRRLKSRRMLFGVASYVVR